MQNQTWCTGRTGAPVSAPPALVEFYGYDKTKLPADPVSSLQQVPELLKRIGISYFHLIELLKTQFLNPQQAMTLDTPESAYDLSGRTEQIDPCNLTYTTIKNLDEAALRKMHRLIRL